MRRSMVSLVLAGAVGLTTGLAGCTSGASGADSSGGTGSGAPATGATTGPAAPPSYHVDRRPGQATVVVGGATRTVDVTCTQRGDTRQASGSKDQLAVTVTLAPQPTVVLVESGSTGSVIHQAASDLRDAAGQVVGSVKVTSAAGAEPVTGEAVFVVIRLDKAGKRLADSTGGGVSGTFSLSCPQGFGAVTEVTASAPTTSG